MAKRIVDPEISRDHSPFSARAGKLSAIVAGQLVARHDVMGVLLAVYVYL